MSHRFEWDFIVLTPPGVPDPLLAIAGSRAGAIGVLNLEFARDPTAALQALQDLATRGRGRLGVLIDGQDEDLANAVLESAAPGLETVIFTTSAPERLPSLVARTQAGGRRAYLVVTSAAEAALGLAAGVDALLAKGHEAGGWVGEETSFVLLQRLIASFPLPVWAYGGIGEYTAAAAFAAGAAGAVLDNQLLLTRESPLGRAVRERVRAMDGSETICLGAVINTEFRHYFRPSLPPVEALLRLETSLATAQASLDVGRSTWRAQIRQQVDWGDPEAALLAIGQDAAFASGLAKRYETVGGIIAGLRRAIAEQVLAARRLAPLAEGSPLAQSHGTRWPIVQGPMTRVSDRAEFAAAVAGAGALPFLALALMRAPEVERLLEETRAQLGNRPWGVGILGFIPPELRAEQLAVIQSYHPPFVLIAGGRPDQARALEAQGIPSYLHVPSPGLLRLYLKDGARRFVFEGRECGGHVGPRTSFVLWETMIHALLEDLPSGASPADFQVLFAGGIHDARSAAMVAAMAAPLAERGIRIGVLLGTAYLFTEEAVRWGAITADFQTAAIDCQQTVLLESGPGHATRCVPSPFVTDFLRERRRLIQSQLPPEEIRNRLEELNIGRLRIAAKGVDRDPRFGRDPKAPKLIPLSAEEQWARGMFMIGQVAALRQQTCTLAALHEDVGHGSRDHLEAREPSTAEERAPAPAAVAIVGIGCILPGASDRQTFWANILGKVDAITEVPASRWDWRQYYDPDRAARDRIYSRWGGFIDDVPFDPVEFGMPPSTLPSIEPFQLLALKVVREALNDAGYASRPFPRERTSVVLGAGGGGADLTAGYMVRSSLPSLFGRSAAGLTDHLDGALPEWTEDSFAGILMNVSAGRVANRFDFGGVNFTIDAACASSLAAIYLAVRDLETHTSDVVVAGGVDAIQNPFAYLCFSKTQALSPNGRCRPFDAEADGIAISEGFAAVVLKRLADAERDGDRIYAVIRGVGGASDGRDRSLTAPRPEGQMRALRRAYAQAGFSPSTVGLIEAHGTGTVAGDQAEIEALTSVFSAAGGPAQHCAVGSVKSMIGHTKATAGVAGLIKAALALHHRVLPPTLGVTRPNPKANFPSSPFYVNTEARPWTQGDPGPARRAGVSAFGFGGTDFHIAVEEYVDGFLPDRAVALDRWPAELFWWCGESPAEITALIDRLILKFEQGARPRLVDLAYTLAQQASNESRAEAKGRKGSNLAVVAESTEDLCEKLDAARRWLADPGTDHPLPHGVYYSEEPLAREGKIAFLFPGQGSQTVNMARELATIFPEVRASFDRADRVLAHAFDRPLSRYVFPPPGFTDDDEKRRQAELTATNIAQPALGATDLALFQLLRSLGVTPDLVAGHSYGEFVALCAAGCFDEETLLLLSEARGRFIREGTADGEGGTMAAVEAAPEALRDLLTDPELTLANLNAPEQTVISGTVRAIEQALIWCQGQDLRARRLPVACAFHSPLVAPAQRRLAELLREIPIRSPQVPVFSNATAAPYPQDPSRIVELLSAHLTCPVEFVREVTAMEAAGARIFVEVGPRSVLSGLVGRILHGRPHRCVSLDQAGRSGLVQFLHALAALIAEGTPVAMARLFEGRTVRALDLEALEREDGTPRYTPTTWLINGGRARPAGRENNRPAPIAVTVDSLRPTPVKPSNGAIQTPRDPDQGRSGPPATEAASHPTDPVVRHPPESAGPAARIIPAPESRAQRIRGTPALEGSPVQGPPAPGIPSGAAASHPTQRPLSPVDDVMGKFQQVMQHFLETQRAVMLTYLGQPTPPETVNSRRGIGNTTIQIQSSSDGPAVRPALTALPIAKIAEPGGATERASAVPRSPAGVREVDGVAAQNNHQSQSSGPMPAAPPAPTPDHGGVPSREQLTERLLVLVSERTGYPSEMLALDADLEADLGIDSIKRVEIAGSMLKTMPMVNPGDAEMERLTGSRTLRQVVDVLEGLITPPEPAAVAGGAAPRPFDFAAGMDTRISRFLVRAVPIPAATTTGGLADGVVVIVDDAAGVGAALEARLRHAGKRTVRIVGAAAEPTADLIVADLRTPEAAQQVLAELRERSGPVSALIHLGALRSRGDEIGLELDRWHQRLNDGLVSLFLLSQALQPDLERAAGQGGAVVLGATTLGGAFAIDSASKGFSATDGGIPGFLKSLAAEWPSVRVKAVDLSAAPADEIAGWLFAEFQATDGRAEVGYRNGQRIGIELVSTPASEAGSAPGTADRSFSNHPAAARNPLGREAVLLVTGGARGITAEVAVTLAAADHPRLVLIGRTPLPGDPEAPSTANLADPREIRRAILQRRRLHGQSTGPADVEEEFRGLTRQREVRDTLARLESTGVRVDYFACDVRDAAALAGVIDEVYRRYGRIDGVIHGAGVIEDKLVRDKELASFQRILATKVDSAVTLAKCLRPDSLRFLILFSSVSGRFGNRGQGDYAAASEILNKLAQWLDRRWAARVMSINWGPWLKTGMVSAEVQRQFAERGVALIPPETGCRRLDEEIRQGQKGEVEVLIGGFSPASTPTDAARPGPAPDQGLIRERPEAADESVRLAGFPLLASHVTARRIRGGWDLRRRFDLDHDLYLRDHCLDGRPVLPFAVAMELMAEAAAAGRPDLVVAEVQNIRVFRGITFDQGGRSVRVLARPSGGVEAGVPLASAVSVDVTISPDAEPTPVLYRATVQLQPRGTAGPERAVPDPTILVGARPLPLSVAAAYRAWLFHGPLFQHLASIEEIGPTGARSTIRRSRPGDCLKDAPLADWLIDPIVIDSAFQLQVIWARLHWDVTLLPASVGAYRGVAPLGFSADAEAGDAGALIRHEMRIRPESTAPLCHVDHTFFDAEGRLLGMLSDVEGVGTRALNRLAAGSPETDGRATGARP